MAPSFKEPCCGQSRSQTQKERKKVHRSGPTKEFMQQMLRSAFERQCRVTVAGADSTYNVLVLVPYIPLSHPFISRHRFLRQEQNERLIDAVSPHTAHHITVLPSHPAHPPDDYDRNQVQECGQSLLSSLRRFAFAPTNLIIGSVYLSGSIWRIGGQDARKYNVERRRQL